MSKEKQAWEVYVDDPEGVREVVFTGTIDECIKFGDEKSWGLSDDSEYEWSLDIRKKEVNEMAVKAITVSVDINIDESLEKAKRYVELLKEAKSLVEELASVEFKIEVK